MSGGPPQPEIPTTFYPATHVYEYDAPTFGMSGGPPQPERYPAPVARSSTEYGAAFDKSTLRNPSTSGSGQYAQLPPPQGPSPRPARGAASATAPPIYSTRQQAAPDAGSSTYTQLAYQPSHRSTTETESNGVASDTAPPIYSTRQQAAPGAGSSTYTQLAHQPSHRSTTETEIYATLQKAPASNATPVHYASLGGERPSTGMASVPNQYAALDLNRPPTSRPDYQSVPPPPDDNNSTALSCDAPPRPPKSPQVARRVVDK